MQFTCLGISLKNKDAQSEPVSVSVLAYLLLALDVLSTIVGTFYVLKNRSHNLKAHNQNPESNHLVWVFCTTAVLNLARSVLRSLTVSGIIHAKLGVQLCLLVINSAQNSLILFTIVNA